MVLNHNYGSRIPELWTISDSEQLLIAYSLIEDPLVTISGETKHTYNIERYFKSTRQSLLSLRPWANCTFFFAASSAQTSSLLFLAQIMDHLETPTDLWNISPTFVRLTSFLCTHPYNFKPRSKYSYRFQFITTRRSKMSHIDGRCRQNVVFCGPSMPDFTNYNCPGYLYPSLIVPAKN